MVKGALLITLVALGILGCDEPIILESSLSACRNGLDDDGDGNADCDDIECMQTSICERTSMSCQNGVDDDGDGRTDCEARACLELLDTPCVATDSSCVPATGAGCLRGLTCTVTDGTGEATRCQPPGTIEEGGRCAATSECGLGLSCALGFCSSGCLRDDDCVPAARCLLLREGVGLCSQPCTPFDAAESCEGETCIALHNVSFSFDEGGASFACMESVVAAPFLGAAEEGAACAARVNQGTTPRSAICAEGLTCVMQVDSTSVCRRGCALSLGGSGFGCAPTERCTPSYPADPRLEEGDFVPGTCECDPGSPGCP